jgi:hypothetical protein
MEALEDFSALLRAIRDAAGSSFRPVPIILTWDSFFRNVLGSAFLDVTNISSDADEIGATWANVLIEEVLVKLKEDTGIPIVLVGHSFGARLLARAANSGALLRSGPQGSVAGTGPAIDVFIGLQAAMSLSRLMPGNPRSFDHLRQEVRTAIFTTSTFDRAARWPGLVGVTYVSSSAAFRHAKEEGGETLRTTSVDRNGQVLHDSPEHASWARYCGSGAITLVNADDLIQKSKGLLRGAHDDVYSGPMGRMIWDIIRACAPR